MKIIQCFCIDIPASKTALLLNLNLNTINYLYILFLFRDAIYIYQTHLRDQLVCSIEVDESYFGAKRQRRFHEKLKRGCGTLKQPVFDIFERNGRVYTEIVPDCKMKTLQSFILGKVALERVIYGDGQRGYNGLVDVGYSKHLRVNHGANEFARGQCHINGIESFWSFCERRLSKFNGISKEYFDYHLKDEKHCFTRALIKRS